jgi:hypothetical protein
VGFGYTRLAPVFARGKQRSLGTAKLFDQRFDPHCAKTWSKKQS